jgi:hypothetical protein
MKVFGALAVSVLGLWATASAQPPAAKDSLGQKLGAISAAVISANAQTAQRLGLIARVEVQPDEIVEFYEPSPGVIFVSGAGSPSGPSILNGHDVKGQEIEDVWSLAASGRPMPPALQSALKRRDEQRAVASGPVASVGGSSGGKTGGRTANAAPATNLSDGTIGANGRRDGTGGGRPNYCRDEYPSLGLAHCGRPYDYSKCYWAYAWPAQEGHDDVARMSSAVCPLSGDVWFTANGAVGGQWRVPQDTVRWISYISSTCELPILDCPTIATSVRPATSGQPNFHFKFGVLAE